MTRELPMAPQAFWLRTVRVGPCLEWTGTRDKFGYGRVGVNGRDVRASRLAWVLSRGPIPDGMFVCHTCDNKACVEPLHLFLGTSADNTRDHVAKGRSHLNGRSGEGNSQARLTSAQVAEVRNLVASGLSTRQIASRYSVSHQQISRIATGKRRASD